MGDVQDAARRAASNLKSKAVHHMSLSAKFDDSNSILREAVEVARIGGEVLEVGLRQKACVVVLYETAESMLDDLTGYLRPPENKQTGGSGDDRGVEVVACVDAEEIFGELRAMEKTTAQRFVCFWSSNRAQDPRNLSCMNNEELPSKHFSMNGNCKCSRNNDCLCFPKWVARAPLAPPTKYLTLLTLPAQTLKAGGKGKHERNGQRDKLLTALNGLFTWCAVTQGKQVEYFSDMKIPTVFTIDRGETQPSFVHLHEGERSTAKRRRVTPVERESGLFNPRRSLTPEENKMLEKHGRVLLGERQELHKLYSINPNPSMFEADETYTAQLRNHFDNEVGTKLTSESVKEWERELSRDACVKIPGSREERPISGVVEEMRSKQLKYLGILYHDYLHRQRDGNGGKFNPDTDQAFNDAIERVVRNKVVSAILEADPEIQRFKLHQDHREKLRHVLRICINDSVTPIYGLAKFSELEDVWHKYNKINIKN